MEYQRSQEAVRRTTSLRYRIESRRGLVPDTTIGVVVTTVITFVVVGLASLVVGNDPAFTYWAVVSTALVIGRKVSRLNRLEQLYRR